MVLASAALGSVPGPHRKAVSQSFHGRHAVVAQLLQQRFRRVLIPLGLLHLRLIQYTLQDRQTPDNGHLRVYKRVVERNRPVFVGAEDQTRDNGSNPDFGSRFVLGHDLCPDERNQRGGR